MKFTFSAVVVVISLCFPLVSGLAAKPLETNKVVSRVAVAGATGRTGRWVVRELLQRGVPVVALCRNMDKAVELFGLDEHGSIDPSLAIVQCDLAGETEAIECAVESCDAAIWCASGVTDNPEESMVEKAKKLLGFAFNPPPADVVGLPVLAQSLQMATQAAGTRPLPKMVMLSSSGVTRVKWSKQKKDLFPGAADIPIVRLNPFNILDYKAQSEVKLRETGVDYCIVRPCGLNDKWPAGSRPIFTQGDVAVGRINRKDVAQILVDALSVPEATGKTFEVVGVAGYAPPESIGPALARLRRDEEGPIPLEKSAATYAVLQQLLPGEKQDSAALAMGQTYEQLDKGEEGRLGEKGSERVQDISLSPPAPPSTE